MAAIDAIKSRAEETMTTIQSHRMAGPLGKAMYVTGEIVKELGDFIPGAGIIGGALTIGAALLRPRLSSVSPEQQAIMRSRIDVEEMRGILRDVADQNEDMSDALISLKKEIGPTFNMVTDLRYKVSRNKGHSSKNI